MRDDWQPGDLALCLKIGPWTVSGFSGPKAGRIYNVAELYLRAPSGIMGLVLEEFPKQWWGFHHTRFRKIRPHTPDDEDVETIRLLTGTPVREPVA